MKKLLACLIVIFLIGGVFGIAIQGTVNTDVAVVDSVIDLLKPPFAAADTLFVPVPPPPPLHK
ncbi:MAG: hypothetical protein AYK18_08105 [Theionarchaea archaeon DG-70]|nr:MAG: hypothetical protein AYK18_08105 [Theionarchaea archaeon DG-70]